MYTSLKEPVPAHEDKTFSIPLTPSVHNGATLSDSEVRDDEGVSIPRRVPKMHLGSGHQLKNQQKPRGSLSRQLLGRSLTLQMGKWVFVSLPHRPGALCEH